MCGAGVGAHIPSVKTPSAATSNDRVHSSEIQSGKVGLARGWLKLLAGTLRLLYRL